MNYDPQLNISPAIRKRLTLWTRVVFTVLAAFLVTIFQAPGVVKAAFSTDDLHDITNNYAWYDPTAICDAANDGSAAATLSGSALDLLKGQKGLDPRWAPAIVGAAKAAGVDPLAMASVLWWEHRSFPAYGAGASPGESDSVGRGPWQITRTSWGSAYGDYATGVYDPVKATEAAAAVVKAKGGVPGLPIGSITDSFPKGGHTVSIAGFAKGYNAGEATWRDPSTASWHGSRTWMKGSNGAWGSDKNTIIDDYIVGASYVYFQIAKGQQVKGFTSNDEYAQEGLSHNAEMKGFVFKDTGSTSSADAPPAGDATSSSCTCDANTSGSQPVIVVDPGHSGEDKSRIDPATNIQDHDYPNQPEMNDVFDVATQVKSTLEKAGYKVILTKTSANETVFHRDRAEIANQANAALAISIHDQAGSSGGIDFDKGNNFVYVQKNGLYREDQSGKKVAFNNDAVAQKSQQYGQIFADTRSSAEGHKVTVTTADLSGRSGLADGNIWLVQLFSKVPWVYNEAGGNSDGKSGLSDGDKKKYADGLVKSVEKAVPTTGAASSGTAASGACGGADGAPGNGDIVKTAKYYAWPNQVHNNDADKSAAKLTYQQDMPKIAGNQQLSPFSDCGLFVSTVMRASGADKSYYIRGTGQQLNYVQTHKDLYDVYDNLDNTSQLKPGDVFVINVPGGPGHTYIYTGDYKGDDGKTYNIAAASWTHHVPQAGTAFFTQEGYHYHVARLKSSSAANGAAAAAAATSGGKGQSSGIQ